MSFFGNDFFKGAFFKNSFFGGDFFQEAFFDDTTIAHPLSAGTVTATTITIVCNNDVTGTLDVNDFEVTIDGVAQTPTDAVIATNAITLTVTTMTAGQAIHLSIKANELNNVGIIDNDIVVNDLV